MIPKALRESLGLEPGQTLEVVVRDGRLEIEVAPTAMKLRRRSGRLAAVPDEELPPLTSDLVRDTLDQVRR